MSASATRRGIGALVIVSGCAVSGASAQPALHRLGFLGSSGPSIAYGISADGNVAVGQSLTESDGFRAFRWTLAGGMQNLGAFENGSEPGAQSSIAYATNGDGSVIVGASVRPDSLNEQGSPFRWTSSLGMVYLGTLGGTAGGVARAIDLNGGMVVGTSSSPSFDYHAFRRPSPGAIAELAMLPGFTDATAMAITPDDRTIVGQMGTQGVIWTLGGSTATILQPRTPNAFTAATAVTADGLTIAGLSGGRAVRWTDGGGTPTNLGLIPGGMAQSTYITSGMSADGNVIVGLGNYNVSEGTGNPFIWDAVNGMRDLNVVATQAGIALNGFQMFYPMSISADGLVIAGYGFSPTDQEAFVVSFRTGAAPCYPNCDASTASPVLNVADFTCFLQKYAASDTYANCDASTAAPTLNVADFTCFLQKYAAGCP